MLPLLLPAVLSFAPAAAQGPEASWPQFRGPHHDNTVEDGQWSSTGKEEPLWQAAVGQGYGTPTILDGRLVVTGYREDPGEDQVLCFDAATGEPLWRQSWPATDQPEYHDGGTLTSATLHAGKAYLLSREGVLRVLALKDGEILWSMDYAKEFGLSRTFHGVCTSPLVAPGGERLVLQLGGTLVVAALEDGSIAWSSEDRGDGSYSNPEVFSLDGSPAIAAVLAFTFVVHDLESGDLLYEFPWKLKGSAVHCATPLVFGNRVFLSTAYNKGCAMIQLGAGSEPTQIWGHKSMRNKVTSCVPHEQHLYGFDESMLRCVGMDGSVAWRKRGLGLGSLTRAGDRLLVLNSDGELLVVAADPAEYRELSRRKVLDGGVYWTSPVFCDGLIYVRNSHGQLACLDHRIDGETTAGAVARAEQASAPSADALFAALPNAGAELPEDLALQLTGTWEIVLRGLPPSPMTWNLRAPDRWRMDLDEGGLSYGFDGSTAWAIEPQGTRLVEGTEAAELRALGVLKDLLTPTLPQGAVVDPTPRRFAERDCWRVRAPGPDGTGERVFWFEVETGRWIGSEGTDRSSLVFAGTQELDDLVLPGRITRYREEDGQEHVLTLTHATWVEDDEALTAVPPGVQRLLRDPAQLAAATEALRARFPAVLGTYRDEEEDIDIVMFIENGDLWFHPKGRSDPLRIDVAGESEGIFPIDGAPMRLQWGPEESGKAQSLIMIWGRGPQAQRITMPRISDR